MLVWKAGRLAVEVWSFPTLLAPPPHPEAPPAPSALRIPSPLTSGWAAACLTRASVRCPGTPCYYCDLHKRPPTHTPSPHYSQQSDPSNHPLPPSLPPSSSSPPPPFIYSVVAPHRLLQCLCALHTSFFFPVTPTVKLN